MGAKLTSGPAKRPTNQNQQRRQSADDPDPNIAEVLEKLSVAALVAENLEVLLGAVDKQLESHGIYHRNLIHMIDLARRLAAAQRDLLTSKSGSRR